MYSREGTVRKLRECIVRRIQISWVSAHYTERIPPDPLINRARVVKDKLLTDE
jgi:hypothetical protein